jgi:hypothetical protein
VKKAQAICYCSLQANQNAEYCLKNVVFSMIATIVETDVSRFSMPADFVVGYTIVVAQLLKVDP